MASVGSGITIMFVVRTLDNVCTSQLKLRWAFSLFEEGSQIYIYIYMTRKLNVMNNAMKPTAFACIFIVA